MLWDSAASSPRGITTVTATARHAPSTLTQVLSSCPGAAPDMMVLMVALQTAGKIIASKV